jgi:predicted NBD/HSP70 family sugar kinase
MPRFSQTERNILQIIRRRGQLSRADLSRLSGLSPTTILDATSTFKAMRLIEVSQSESRGGRRPMRIKLRDDLAHALGIDLGTNFVRAVVTDMNGTIVSSHKAEREPFNYSRLKVPDIEGVAATALVKARKRKEDLAVIGIGITGFINEAEKKCLFLNKVPEWTDFPVADHYARVFGNPHIAVKDSVNAMAFAEKQLGSCRDEENFVYIAIGMGLGSSIYVNARPLMSRYGISGEIGHIDISQNESICCCGNRGCLESSASGWAVVKRCKEALDTGVVSSLNSVTDTMNLTVKDIIDAAHTGDKLSTSLIRESAREIAIGISVMINILNPNKIVLSGGIVRGAGDLFLAPLKAEVHAHVLPWLQKNIEFSLSGLGEYDSATGSALVALDEYFFEILDGN